ncbi:MAG: hypothetical protein JWQ38_2102 [Flavipsychrobacter sp.]|nr:hypothetical protein [Flavipsychrobacter sp.]
MSTIKIYLHGENSRDGQVLEIEDSASLHEVIIKHREVCDPSNNTKTEEYEIFIEDEEDNRDKGGDCKNAGIQHHDKIHCHRCKLVSIILEYNGQQKSISLAPSATGNRILNKASELFNISEADAGYLRLVLPDGNDVEKKQHIGSFVSYPKCEIKLILQSHKKIEG